MTKPNGWEEIRKTISDKFYDAMDINANVSALMGRKICEEVVSQAILSAEANERERLLSIVKGIASEGRVFINNKLLRPDGDDGEIVMISYWDLMRELNNLSLPDQEQLENSKTDE